MGCNIKTPHTWGECQKHPDNRKAAACDRSGPDMHWCTTHGADFAEGERNCAARGGTTPALEQYQAEGR